MSWPLVSLGDCVDIVSGFAFKSSMFNDTGEGLPLIRIRDVVSGSSSTYYSGEFSEDYIINDGDLLIGMDGDFNRANWCGGRALLNQRVCKITAKDGVLDQQYLYHLLPRELDRIHAATPAVTVKHLSVKGIRAIELPLPPLKEQQRIAAILDKADAIRRKRQQAIALADEFLRSVFLDMFGDPVTNPKEWEAKPLKEMAVVTTGNTPSRKEAKYYGDYIEWIKSDNINTPSHFLTHATECLSKEGAKIGRVVSPGSVLITCIAGSFDCIGNAAYADRSVAFNQQINALTPKDDVDSWFLYALILFSKRHIQSASTNSMKGMVSKGKMEKISMICPPLSAQKHFTNILLKFLELNSRTLRSSKCTEDSFAAFSQKAFSGRL